jgi:hypothetical protein
MAWVSQRLSVIGDGATLVLASGPASVKVIASIVTASRAFERLHPAPLRAAASAAAADVVSW